MPLPDIDDYTATFGGSKINASAVEDPTTDEDAATRNQYVADVAMMTGTAPRAWVNFVANTTTGGMSITAHYAVWGTGVSVVPTPARSSAGTYTITFPASVNDALGNSHTVNLRAGWGQVRDGTAGWDMLTYPTSANVMTVFIRNAAGTLADPAGINVDLFAI